MKKKIKKLRSGDLILFRVTKNSPIHDKLIGIGEWLMRKKFTRHDYCHIAMVDSDTDLMLEAVWPRTHVIKIDWAKMSKINDLEVYRVKRATKVQREKAISWAHKNIGVRYNIGLLLFGWFPMKHQVICSTYVGKSWHNAHVVLSNSGRMEKLLSPDEIAANTKVLKRIM
jgi:hypothetical protein